MKEFISNLNDDNFSEARSELKDYVQANVTERVVAKQEELGLVIPVEEGAGGDED